MKLTQDQKTTLLAKLGNIYDDRLLIEDSIDSEDFDPRFMGDVADGIIDWATQLSELLYEMEVEDGKDN